MTYRVIQWATGRVGADAITGIVGHPDLELVGTWVHSEAKDGRDIGEVLGREPLGVIATRDKDALLALDAECVCYATARTWNSDPMATVAELERILRAGKNVVNVTWPALVNPRGISDEVYQRLHDACISGGVSLYTGGIDPGFGSMGLALSALTVAADVHSVRMYEILNYAHWNNREWLRDVMGFGQKEPGTLFHGNRLGAIFGPMLHLIADAIGVRIDTIEEHHEAVLADEAFEVPATRIEKGTICGLRFESRAMVGGKARIIVEHVTRLRDSDFAELDFVGGGYRVEVVGTPGVKLDMQLTWPFAAAGSLQAAGSGRPGIFATAMSVVNAIPQVCAAPPGVITYLDLLPHPSRNMPA